MSLEKEIALVTGASRGIGKAIALGLGQQAAVVVGTATSQSGADNINAVLEANNIKGKGYVLDVTEQSSVDQLLSAVQPFW